jgi:CheY-like chemotaxis protein
MNPARRVLIVDDEESVRTLAERVLHRAGYETAVAVDGPEALRIVEGQPPFDLLLADVVMPEMHGDELARQLRGREPDLKVLYFTGYSDQLFAEGKTMGEHEAFLEKPVTANGLVEAVSLMLSGHPQRPNREVLEDFAEARSVRVTAPALSVRVGGTVGRLANISATGALVYLPHTLQDDREWTMRIEMEPQPVELQVRVVRSHSVSVSLPDVMWQHQEYAVALAFTALEPAVEEALKTLTHSV